MGSVVRPEHAEGVHGLPPHRLVDRRELGDVDPLGGGPFDDLVLDVGDVGHVGDLVAR